jgi:hypothetical protein
METEVQLKDSEGKLKSSPPVPGMDHQFTGNANLFLSKIVWLGTVPLPA